LRSCKRRRGGRGEVRRKGERWGWRGEEVVVVVVRVR
jgi:hypothetical protein